MKIEGRDDQRMITPLSADGEKKIWGQVGFEPTTFSLGRSCSIQTELQAHNEN